MSPTPSNICSPPQPESEQDLMMPFGNWVVTSRPLPATGPPGLLPKMTPQAEPIPHVHSDSATTFVSSFQSSPQPRSEERRLLSQAPGSWGERLGCVMQAPFRICVVLNSYTSSCLFEAQSLLRLLLAVAPKGGGFVLWNSHSRTSGLWQEGSPGFEKQHAE